MSTKHSSGFTLVEVALALMVASVGLLGIFSLFPTGVKMNKTAVDETQAAMFAEQVLNGIKAQASITPWNAVRNMTLPPPTPDVWENPSQLEVSDTGTSYETLRYETMGSLVGGTTPYIDFGVRYRLEILDVDDYRKVVRLYVRPGEYGSNKDYVFYTELYNHGQQ